MKIALLHYSAPPVVGGVESVLAHHARLMHHAQHAVQVFAARGEQFDPHIPFVRLPLIDSRHARVLAIKAELDHGYVPSGFEELVDAIYSELSAALKDIDVLIAHNVCSLNKNLALTAAIQRLRQSAKSPRLVLWHHDLAWTTPRYRAELYDGYPWDLLRTDWGARHVVVSELRQRELAELLGISVNAICVVPNGVDRTAFFKLDPETLGLLNQIDLVNAEPILLLPVRITPRKNIELALRVLAALRRTQPHAVLIVTGPLGAHSAANAAYFERLRDLRLELTLTGAAHFIAELVEHPLSDAAIADCYRLADALFLPSREEGFGIPVIEAAFSRLPVFCADIAPLRDLGGEWATYFSPDADPDEVARLIETRLAADQTYQLAVRARRSFTWEQVYADHIAPILEETA
ncbi:MAG: glycosyltransferase family 4 protein [Anaerolineae bacterium]